MPNNSIFTKIINREIPAKICYEDDFFIAFDDINPQAPIHVLIVPKKPYLSLEEVDFDDNDFYVKLLQTARKIAKKLKTQDNYKIFMNIGQQVQAVPHLHLHLIGGWSKNKKAQELRKETINLINS